MKTISIIAIIAALVYISYRTYRYMNLDKGLDRVVVNGAVILDVRTQREYITGNIPGSLNIPLSKLHADSLPLDRSKVYVTVCSHGLRSVKAADLLKEKGYKVYNGGAWNDLADELKKHGAIEQ